MKFGICIGCKAHVRGVNGVPCEGSVSQWINVDAHDERDAVIMAYAIAMVRGIIPSTNNPKPQHCGIIEPYHASTVEFHWQGAINASQQ